MAKKGESECKMIETTQRAAVPKSTTFTQKIERKREGETFKKPFVWIHQTNQIVRLHVI